MADERFGISVNLKRVAPTQYRNFDFNSMCVMRDGTAIGVNEDGIFSLDDAEKDNGTNIASYIEFPTTDFGHLGAKRFRKLYAGYETSGSLKFTVKVDGGAETSFTLTPAQVDQLQHRGILPVTRAQKGVYWIFRVENVNGCDFSLDNIEGIPVVLTRGRR